MVDSMWRYTGYSKEFPPKLYFKFDKNFAVAVFGWVTPENKNRRKPLPVTVLIEYFKPSTKSLWWQFSHFISSSIELHFII
jgi:hypothetical protein